MIMIVSKPINIIRWGRVIKKKAALVEIVSDNRYIPFGGVNEHLKRKDRMLRMKT